MKNYDSLYKSFREMSFSFDNFEFSKLLYKNRQTQWFKYLLIDFVINSAQKTLVDKHNKKQFELWLEKISDTKWNYYGADEFMRLFCKLDLKGKLTFQNIVVSIASLKQKDLIAVLENFGQIEIITKDEYDKAINRLTGKEYKEFSNPVFYTSIANKLLFKKDAKTIKNYVESLTQNEWDKLSALERVIYKKVK